MKLSIKEQERHEHGSDTWTGTLTVKKRPADIQFFTVPEILTPTIEPGGVVTIAFRLINAGDTADVPHVKIYLDIAVYLDKDIAGSLAPGATTDTINAIFNAPTVEKTYDVTVKVWGKTTETEP